jgi:hypothetical protein
MTWVLAAQGTCTGQTSMQYRVELCSRCSIQASHARRTIGAECQRCRLEELVYSNNSIGERVCEAQIVQDSWYLGKIDYLKIGITRDDRS